MEDNEQMQKIAKAIMATGVGLKFMGYGSDKVTHGLMILGLGLYFYDALAKRYEP